MGKGLIVVYFCGSRTGLKRVMILYDPKYEAWLKINHPDAVYMCTIDKCVSTVLLLETLLFKVHAQSVYMTSCEMTLTPCMMMMKHLLVMKS